MIDPIGNLSPPLITSVITFVKNTIWQINEQREKFSPNLYQLNNLSWNLSVLLLLINSLDILISLLPKAKNLLLINTSI